ncbi:MAG TPA: Crp/Fnr family transcriptional regulator [Stellaceae bacterium]|nr:Crp/Fnr family transcriptional regulator [Stellaceae bacterium]
MSDQNADRPVGSRGVGPNIVAPGIWEPLGAPGRVLTPQESSRLAVISSLARFPKGGLLYSRGDRADAIFNLVGGTVKAFKTPPGGAYHIVGFFFADDVVGLAANGKYVNSAEAITNVTAYRMPTMALEALLRSDPLLEFNAICKLSHELDEAQRHALLLSRGRVLSKVGLFLQMLENSQATRGENTEEIYLPMTRSDIAAYIGASLEAVSRSLRALSAREVLAFRDRHHVKILDHARLEAIATEYRK